MVTHASPLTIARALASSPHTLRVKPSINWFLFQYLRKFRAQQVGKNIILHSHLPPLNSRAYKRFITEHLIDHIAGPSHAQIGLTNACPQRCKYCYSKRKTGRVMDADTIIRLIRELKQMGMIWLGFTGGEPLLNKEIVRITESAAEGCAVKLFTTGCTLTPQRARELQSAGLFSVCVSLDHWVENIHDEGRRYPGAFQTALRAIDIFKNVGGIHVGVSAVISSDMIRNRHVDTFLEFLNTLDIHEAWLSEAKPSIPELWNAASTITEEDRVFLAQLQDRYNKGRGMTLNYLGHFEGKEHFGCAAGNKMVYIDACGNVSPCVFLPLRFGNVQEQPLHDVYAAMHHRFPTESDCFVNTNYSLLRKHYHGQSPLNEQATARLMEEVRFSPMSRFFQLHYSGDAS